MSEENKKQEVEDKKEAQVVAVNRELEKQLIRCQQSHKALMQAVGELQTFVNAMQRTLDSLVMSKSDNKDKQ